MVLQRRHSTGTTSTSTSTTLARQPPSTASFLPDPQQQQDDDDNTSSSHFYDNLIAGVCSGTATSIVCAPLDLLRTRLQVLGDLQSSTATSSSPRAVLGLVRHMWQTEGVAGYFRGLHATLWTVPAFWGVYFPLYEDLKRKGFQHKPEYHPSVIHMGAAVGAGAVADVLCNPMFVIRTRLQTEALHHATVRPVPSVLSTAQTLYAEGGVRSFWRGMTANLLGLSHVAVQFPVYEHAKVLLHVDEATHPGPLLLASGVSKLVACILTYPHEVLRSRMMDARGTRSTTTSPTPASLVETCVRIVQREGVGGLYAGLPLSILRVLPNTAVTFCVYEWTVRQLKQQCNRNSTIV